MSEGKTPIHKLRNLMVSFCIFSYHPCDKSDIDTATQTIITFHPTLTLNRPAFSLALCLPPSTAKPSQGHPSPHPFLRLPQLRLHHHPFI